MGALPHGCQVDHLNYFPISLLFPSSETIFFLKFWKIFALRSFSTFPLRLSIPWLPGLISSRKLFSSPRLLKACKHPLLFPEPSTSKPLSQLSERRKANKSPLEKQKRKIRKQEDPTALHATIGFGELEMESARLLTSSGVCLPCVPLIRGAVSD